MWMTGFDAPSVLDDLPRPADAQPHPDADDRPGQPGLPRQGQRADRRLHRRVPEPREGARDLRRGQRRGRRRLADPGQVDALVAALGDAIDAVVELCERYDVDLDELRDASGFASHRPARRRGRGAAGRRGDARPSSWPRPATSGSCSRRCCPTRRPPRTSATVAAIRVLAERIADVVTAAAGRHRRGRRRGRRAARPLRRCRGVRHPGRSRGQRARPADRPVADRLRRARRAVRRPQAGRDRPARRAAASNGRSAPHAATRPATTWSSASRS